MLCVAIERPRSIRRDMALVLFRILVAHVWRNHILSFVYIVLVTAAETTDIGGGLRLLYRKLSCSKSRPNPSTAAADANVILCPSVADQETLSFACCDARGHSRLL